MRLSILLLALIAVALAAPVEEPLLDIDHDIIDDKEYHVIGDQDVEHHDIVPHDVIPHDMMLDGVIPHDVMLDGVMPHDVMPDGVMPHEVDRHEESHPIDMDTLMLFSGFADPEPGEILEIP